MQTFTFLTVAVAALLQGAVAVPAPEVTPSPTSLPGHYECTSIATVTTTTRPHFVCDIVCPTPKSTCQPGEPTLKPVTSFTTTPLPGCTVSVVDQMPGCGCASCLAPQPTA
ncbi:uncharacterized protein F4807DRAFT_222232 [Annulohypoxylon truncatum]|uniref:uncharacterized protein n=1 Tax=Annulohypoxylon truncatum TaxID=327061 RepID=UPI002008CB68|nr:uncharacterized protein F4807DRAFT_222232 [Annulohypoxylon truncatum]KAI1206750.1 hypothetical protein F4807DRAFT_222232 [Annulohypoxylon truncatum]